MRAGLLLGTVGTGLAALALGACGSSPATTTPTTTGPEVIGTTAGPGGAQKLTVTAALSAQLLAAGARAHDLAVADFTGLTAGLTYYAYDPATSTYWAGAQLKPSMSSIQAQVSVQDDGSYDLFTRTSTGTWHAFADGLGTLPGSVCAIVVPPEVRTVWGWSQGAPCGGPPS